MTLDSPRFLIFSFHYEYDRYKQMEQQGVNGINEPLGAGFPEVRASIR